MPENHRTEQVPDETISSEEEIELIDLLRTIWRSKYLIIIGTITFLLIAAFGSLFLPKIYRVEMIVKPGLKKIDFNDKKIFISTPEKMKSLLEGEIKYELRDSDQQLSGEDIDRSFRNYSFKADDIRNILSINCFSSDPSNCIANLQNLTQLLSKKMTEAVDFIKNRHTSDIEQLKFQLMLKQNEEKIVSEKIEKINNRLTGYVIKDDKSISRVETAGRSEISLLDYSSVVEKLIDLYQTHSRIITQISFLKKDIDRLVFERERAQGLQIVYPPNVYQKPVKPRTKLLIIVSAGSGFFLMIFIAFIIEYIRNTRSRSKYR